MSASGEHMSIHSKVPEILLNLADKGPSGVFRVQNASSKKQLIIKNGTIAFAESNQPEEHLAHVMVSMGLLKKSDIREVVSLMKAGKNSEEAVTAVHHSDREAVGRAIREQVIIVLSSILGGHYGDMRFFTGEDLVKNRTNMGLHVAEMLVFSARRAVSSHLVTVPEGFLQGNIVANKAWTEKRMEFPLDETESYAYARTHDTIPAKELIPLITPGEGAPEDVLMRLFVLGLIEPETPQSEPSADIAESAALDELLLKIEDMLLRFKTDSLYGILAVKTDAGPEEIQNAYHALAKQFHPDRFQAEKFSSSVRTQAEEMFAYINKAYKTLRDPKLRSRYDEKGVSPDSRAEPVREVKKESGSEDEKMIEALFLQGRRSLAQGDFEKAAKELKSCVYLRPEKANYNYCLGLAESEIPRLHKSAEQHFLKAIELERIPGESHIALAKLYLGVGLPGKAALWLDELLSWDPENPKALKLREEIKEKLVSV